MIQDIFIQDAIRNLPYNEDVIILFESKKI